jgi:hypothetical protein
MTLENKELSQEIDEFIGSLTNEPSPEPTPPAAEPPTGNPPPEETPPSGEPPKPDEGAPVPKSEGELTPTPTPPAEPPKVEPPAQEEETLEELRERNKLLLARVEELTPVPGVTATPTPKPDESGVPTPTPAPPTAPVVVGEEIDFLAGQSVDDLIDDPKKFNTLLNSIYLKAKSDAKEDAAKAVLTALPGVVSSEVVNTTNTNAVVNEFYQQNEDLVAVKKTVMAVAAQVHAEKPEFGHVDVLKEAAIRTRKLLGLRAPKPKTDSKFGDPAFVDKGGTRTPTNKGPHTLQDEINDFITH